MVMMSSNVVEMTVQRGAGVVVKCQEREDHLFRRFHFSLDKMMVMM